jgi:hypothetical protein
MKIYLLSFFDLGLEVSDQLYAPTAIPPGKETLVPIV